MWFIGMIAGLLVGSIFGGFGALIGAVLGIWLGVKWSVSDDYAGTNDHNTATSNSHAYSREKIDNALYDPTVEQRIASLEKQIVQLNVRIKHLENSLNLTASPANVPATPVATPSSTQAASLAAALQTYQHHHASDPADTPASPDLVATSDKVAPSEPPIPNASVANIPPVPSLTAPPIATPHPPIRAAMRSQHNVQTVTHAKPVEHVKPLQQAKPVEPIKPQEQEPPKVTPSVQTPMADIDTADIDTADVGTPPPAVDDTPALPSFWAKLFGGNILAKIGVVILFFAVASALKLAVEHGMFPVPVRFLLGAVGAVGMTMFGWSRAQTEQHRMFGFALQGGGFGILYLIVYFMLTRHDMITPTWAFIAYTLLGVSCTLMAAKQDSVSLAVLGISGAFLSPVLAVNNGGSHVTLFSYFTLLNVFVFALNWFKSWRQLNIVGFLFTLGIGMNWALSAYQPAHLASTEFFLVLFFLLYSLEPVCYALFRHATAMQWGDGLLLFGTPTVAVASQAVLMHPFEYGQAWSAFVMGLYYLALWGVLYRKNDATLKLSERSHLGIALTLLTYAVPLAFGAQITAAVWTIEGCAVLWLGIRQDRYLARWTGMALQVLAGGYFYHHLDLLTHAHAVFNDVYIGSLIVAATGMISGLMLHRWEKKTQQFSANAMFAWGLTWFVVSSYLEIARFVLAEYQNSAWLTYFAALVLCLEFGGKHWVWQALRNTTLLALALLGVAFNTITQHQHLLTGALTLVYPAAVALYYWLLARQEQDGLSKGLARAAMFWGGSVLVSNEIAWVVQHYLAPNRELWYWLPFGISLSSIAFWRGVRQDEPLARLLAILIQSSMGVYLFEKYTYISHQPAVYNDFFLASMLLVSLAWATAWIQHRKSPTSLGANLLFYWGLGWMVAPVCLEIEHFVRIEHRNAAWLGFFAILVAALEIRGKRDNWLALRHTTWLLFLAIFGVAADAILRERHLLFNSLLFVFPATIALYYWLLSRQEQDGLDKAVARGMMFWGLGTLVSNEVAWSIQHYLSPNQTIWYWLPFSITLAGIALWRGIHQDDPLARWFGAAIQVSAGIYLLENYDTISHIPAIYNDFFLGSLLLAIAAWAAAWTLHRKTPTALIADMLFYWGFAWLVLPVFLEIARFASMATQDAIWLAFFAVLVAVLEWVGKHENWAALRQMISVAFVAIFAVAADATFQAHHVLHGLLIPIFPAALALYYWQLARHERDQFNVGLPALHLGMFWGVAALISHETSWSIQQLTPNNDLWHILAYGISFALINLGTLKAHTHQIFPTTTPHVNYVTTGLLPVVLASAAWFAISNIGYAGSGSGLPYLPVLNPLDLVMLLSLFSIYQWITHTQTAEVTQKLSYTLPAAAFLWVSTLAARLAHNWGGVPFNWQILAHNPMMHALLSVIWTLVSIVLMIYASRQSSRKIWFVGFGLLAIVGAKLMLVDLRNTGTITWTASLFGIALLVIAASYFSPAPPKKAPPPTSQQ